jgi:hypothetical protein
MADPHPPGPPPAPPITSGGAFALEVFRSLGAYGVMFICVILLLRRPAWDLSVVDVVFWTNLIALLVLQRRAAAAGTTRESARARLQLLAVALLLWAGAQSVQLID